MPYLEWEESVDSSSWEEVIYHKPSLKYWEHCRYYLHLLTFLAGLLLPSACWTCSEDQPTLPNIHGFMQYLVSFSVEVSLLRPALVWQVWYRLDIWLVVFFAFLQF